MALTSPPERRARERILLYGPAGSGKSSAALSIAKTCKGHVYVIDTENAYLRMTDEGEWPRLTVHNTTYNAMVNETTEWAEMLAAVRDSLKQMGPDDWLVVDSVTPTWDGVQAWYTSELWGSDLADYMLANRRMQLEASSKGGSPFEGFTDWPVINKEYGKLYNLLINCPGHVLLTAETAEIGEKDDKEIHVTFGAHGAKPKGQKRLPYIPHTVVLTRRQRTGGWRYQTVKDRERTELEEVDAEAGFAKVYLQGVAGWKQEAAFKRAANHEG